MNVILAHILIKRFSSYDIVLKTCDDCKIIIWVSGLNTEPRLRENFQLIVDSIFKQISLETSYKIEPVNNYLQRVNSKFYQVSATYINSNNKVIKFFQ